MGLKEAKELVESIPATLLSNADPAQAAKLKAALEHAGAVVDVK